MEAFKLTQRRFLGWFACIFGFTSVALGQAIPASTRAATLQLGAGYTHYQPDYGPINISGFTIYGDYDLLFHVGVEAEMHRTFNNHTDIGENTYLIGPRAYYIVKHRFKFYGKGMIGRATFDYQKPYFTPSSPSYTAFAAGGGLDIDVAHHVSIRAIDYEYQIWNNFPLHNSPTSTDHLTPALLTFGAAYRF